MARVTLVDDDARPDLAQAVSRIRGARGGRLINVYRLLLNSPSIASAWVDFNSAVRLGSHIEPAVQEIAIIRIAILTRTEYVFRAHVPGYAKDAGLSDAQIDGLFDWPASAAFSDRERAVLGYVDAVTRDIEVPDAVFDALRGYFGEGEIVELTVLASAYNMQCRVLRALKIDPEPGWDLAAARWR
ncbi:MAG: carboxymuconolactone decarboxylase family protein [Betaproteobacteria bacterium]|nr:carboxymuconolactone decarboxylase family protein [Betaproteobacteria bacterium]